MFYSLAGAFQRTRKQSVARLAILITAGFLSACGGGGDNPSTSAGAGGSPAPAPIPAPVPSTAACGDGANFQCSGDSVLRRDNGVAVTSGGVQVYGTSTNDLANPIVNKTSASGLALASSGVAEVRIAKDGNGTPSSPVLLLRNLGLTWDGRTERPLIVEGFVPTQGRTLLTTNGTVTFNTALPDSSNLDFYDYARRGAAGTQANYAGNRYFPRTGNPSRCQPDQTPCPTVETTGVGVLPGDWRGGGLAPDLTSAWRLHEDGDVHAGDGIPDANGNRTILPGGNGPGVPAPGSKGYRSFENLSYRYSNLASWLTQDTVLLFEWGGSDEHNKNRRGVAAFGAVTDPAAIPTSGTATYSGVAQGWYARNATEDPAVFRGTVTVTTDFAARVSTITIQNTITFDASATPVPSSFSTAAPHGTINFANYFTAPLTIGPMSGGVGARYFGPLEGGSSGTGPAETAGSFSLSDINGQVIVAGFIARKR